MDEEYRSRGWMWFNAVANPLSFGFYRTVTYLQLTCISRSKCGDGFKSIASNRFSITFNTDVPMMGSGTALIAFESISANGAFFKLSMRPTESRS